MTPPTLSRDELDARNKRIVQLYSQNTPGRIAQLMRGDYPGITRNTVIGVIQRHADKAVLAARRERPHRIQTTVRIVPDLKPIKSAGDRAQAVPLPEVERVANPLGATTRGKPSFFGKMPTEKPVPVSSPATRGIKGPIEGSTPVPIEERKGCIWPFGDRGPLLYCNLPTCKVRSGGVVHSVKYCPGHWDLRRTTRVTQIIP